MSILITEHRRTHKVVIVQAQGSCKIIVQTQSSYSFNLTSNGKGHIDKEALAIRRIFSLVDMITKPKFSNCPNVF